SCATPDKVAYVSAAPVGTDNEMCDQAHPCTRVAAALATGRPNVKFHGTTSEAVMVGNGRLVTFPAAPRALLTSASGGATVTVQGDGTSLSINDLTISNTINSTNAVGIVVPAASGAPTLTVSRSTITGNQGGGISASGGTLTVSQSTFSANQGGG